MRVQLVRALAAVAVFHAPATASQKFQLTAKLPELEQMAVSDSNDGLAHFNLALGYWNAKRWVDVERHLRLAVQIDPRYAEGYLALSALPYARYRNLGRDQAKGKLTPEMELVLEESRHLQRRALMIDPFVNWRTVGASMRELLDPVRSAISTLRMYAAYTTPMEDFLVGVERFYTGRPAQAFAALDHTLTAYRLLDQQENIPASVLWVYALAAAHDGRYGSAATAIVDLLERALRQEQSDSLLQIPLETNDYRYILAVLLQRDRLRSRAIQYFQEALVADVGLYMAHVRLAELYQAEGLWEEAVAERRRALEVNPDDPSLLLELGHTLALAEQEDEAAAILRQALEANPRNPMTAYVLGLVELDLRGDSAAGRAALERFLAAAPSKMGREIADARLRLQALGQSAARD